LCLGFIFGGLFGAKLAVGLTEVILRKIFGGCLLGIGCYMIFR
jgi:uncharacterized protein